VGAAGIVLALARPQWGVVREKVEREGVDVVLVLDTSGSMATEDVAPNRFFLARAALLSLLAQLEQDRFALVAFEGEAYPLVPLTLDADAVGLFLETLEPGFVPGPGSALGEGLAKGVEMFVDEARRNKVMVIVSDGENLDGEIEPVIRRAREAGIVVHAVGVGTERGEPVPNYDADGNRAGFKQDDAGSVVVSRFDPKTLDAIAKGTGGQLFRIGPADANLRGLAVTVDAMEERTLAREFAYRKKDRFQVPLGIGIGALLLALILPLPALAWRRRAQRAETAAVLVAGLLGAPLAHGQQAGPQGSSADAATQPTTPPSATTDNESSLADELLLRPSRLTADGIEKYAAGDHPGALEAFDAAARARSQAPEARFNLADALYKNGRLDDAASIYESLGEDALGPLAGTARYNLGNTLFEKKDYAGAIRAYRDALTLSPNDPDVRQNLELAMRRLQEQQEQEQQNDSDQKQDEKDQQQQKQEGQDPESEDSESKDSESPEKQEQEQQDQQSQEQKQDESKAEGQEQQQEPKSAEQREQERFEQQAGMPQERAMQLLDALQENEKEEQRKILAARQARKKKGKGKDW
jgi:Ca-activated chloride channel family protein